MKAIIYDKNTGVELFNRNIPTYEISRFEKFLTDHGFTYEENFDSWTNEERGHNAVIYPNE